MMIDIGMPLTIIFALWIVVAEIRLHYLEVESKTHQELWTVAAKMADQYRDEYLALKKGEPT